MTATPGVTCVRNTFKNLEVKRVEETIFFSEHDGQLCQWMDVAIAGNAGRATATIEVRAGGKRARTRAVLPGHRQGEVVRCFAPCLWPEPVDPKARLVVTCGGAVYEGVVIVGTHRPWTMYLLSDLCADDTFAYEDLRAHDRDDYRTTRAELGRGPQNAYNLATSYQAQRFYERASAAEKRAFQRALKDGRLYVTPVPTQLLCGAVSLGAYPMLLDPYRKWIGPMDSHAAYHMEAPTWTNGLVALFRAAGFQMFGKSLLQYRAPWVNEVMRLPRLTRLEAAPGAYVYLVLARGYVEGYRILAGVHETNRLLHHEVIPAHQAQGAEYPLSAIPLVGMYSDLCPSSPEWGDIKMQAVAQYNGQAWDFPKLVNATWGDFQAHVERELGPPDRPRVRTLRAVRGDTGASWEAWLGCIAREAAQFRRVQRDAVSLSALHALTGKRSARTERLLEQGTLHTVYLSDHAWNGSSDGSKAVNLKLRQDRVKAAAAAFAQIRERAAPSGASFQAVNTLGWARPCRVAVRGAGAALEDTQSGERFALRAAPGRKGWREAEVPIPGFGARTLRPTSEGDEAPAATADLPLPLENVRPLLTLDGKEVPARGGWQGQTGAWTVGPFRVEAEVRPGTCGADGELAVAVRGAPPREGYDLRLGFDLPWKRCLWRAETGGGFATPGPADRGGDNLRGIVGSVVSCGEGLSCSGKRAKTRIDFALRESGLCGAGGHMVSTAKGGYGASLPQRDVRATLRTSPDTAPRLEWYLLCTGSNPREHIPDQGGARAWTFACGLRAVRGAFDDADLYRFAAGFHTPAEVVRAGTLRDAPGLALRGSSDVLPLALRRWGRALELDLYNTASARRTVTLGGALLKGKRPVAADMLGRPGRACARGRVSVPPRMYQKVRIG